MEPKEIEWKFVKRDYELGVSGEYDKNSKVISPASARLGKTIHYEHIKKVSIASNIPLAGCGIFADSAPIRAENAITNLEGLLSMYESFVPKDVKEEILGLIEYYREALNSSESPGTMIREASLVLNDLQISN